MAETLSMALAELLRKADAEPDVDTLREGVRVMPQALMELEVSQHLVPSTISAAQTGKRAQWLPRPQLGHTGGYA